MSSSDTFDRQLDQYITLILKLGLNLQEGQTLVIGPGAPAPVEDIAAFIRNTAMKAYELGARDVHVLWNDAELTRTRLRLAPSDALNDVPMWRVKWLEELSEQGAAFLNPYAPDPDLFSDIDPQRIATAIAAGQRAAARFAEAAAKMRHAWLVASVATPTWARKVFPQMPDAEAVDALWRYIFRTTHIDTPDPIQAWRVHLAQLNQRTAYLNQAHFRRLHYSAPGTNLTVDLPNRHIWISGGSSVNTRGVPFVPNLPTEEVFTLPQRNGVHGVVRSTMPLNYNGVLIENLALTFDAGRIIDYTASAGLDALKSIIETDDGAHYLGEVALVPVGSPVNIGTPVFNTLFDENASCHLAIGRAYPICLEGGEEMSQDELAAQGANSSLTHVDFMIGSAQLDIDGETASGERIPVFRAGAWASEVTAP